MSLLSLLQQFTGTSILSAPSSAGWLYAAKIHIQSQVNNASPEEAEGALKHIALSVKASLGTYSSSPSLIEFWDDMGVVLLNKTSVAPLEALIQANMWASVKKGLDCTPEALWPWKALLQPLPSTTNSYRSTPPPFLERHRRCLDSVVLHFANTALAPMYLPFATPHLNTLCAQAPSRDLIEIVEREKLSPRVPEAVQRRLFTELSNSDQAPWLKEKINTWVDEGNTALLDSAKHIPKLHCENKKSFFYGWPTSLIVKWMALKNGIPSPWSYYKEFEETGLIVQGPAQDIYNLTALSNPHQNVKHKLLVACQTATFSATVDNLYPFLSPEQQQSLLTHMSKTLIWKSLPASAQTFVLQEVERHVEGLAVPLSKTSQKLLGAWGHLAERTHPPTPEQTHRMINFLIACPASPATEMIGQQVIKAIQKGYSVDPAQFEHLKKIFPEGKMGLELATAPSFSTMDARAKPKM